MRAPPTPSLFPRLPGHRCCLRLPPTAAQLRSLDLEGVELITDTTLRTLAESSPALESLVLKRCVQVSDDGMAALAANCPAISHLSVNNVPALGDVTMAALRDHCSSELIELDISFCRGVTDAGIGSLVDACAKLRKISLWGCSQLTAQFFDGHSNDALVLVGRCFA